MRRGATRCSPVCSPGGIASSDFAPQWGFFAAQRGSVPKKPCRGGTREVPRNTSPHVPASQSNYSEMRGYTQISTRWGQCGNDAAMLPNFEGSANAPPNDRGAFRRTSANHGSSSASRAKPISPRKSFGGAGFCAFSPAHRGVPPRTPPLFKRGSRHTRPSRNPMPVSPKTKVLGGQGGFFGEAPLRHSPRRRNGQNARLNERERLKRRRRRERREAVRRSPSAHQPFAAHPPKPQPLPVSPKTKVLGGAGGLFWGSPHAMRPLKNIPLPQRCGRGMFAPQTA